MNYGKINRRLALSNRRGGRTLRAWQGYEHMDDAPGGPQAATVDNADELRALASGHARTWLVYTLPAEMEDNHADVLAELARGWRQVRTFPGTLRGGDLLVFLREPAVTPGGT